MSHNNNNNNDIEFVSSNFSIIFRRFCKGLEIPNDDSRIKWKMDNKPGSDKLTESTITLKIPKCGKDDTGDYTLKLENKWGQAESSVSMKCCT